MTAKESYERAAVLKVRADLKKKGAHRLNKSLKRSQQNRCDGTKRVMNQNRACPRRVKETRIWANHQLHFCSECAELWDSTVMKALSGDWGEEQDAVQVKSTTKKVSRRPKLAKAC